MKSFNLPYQDTFGVVLHPFDDNDYSWHDWNGENHWPRPLFAQWLDTLMPHRYRVENWVVKDHHDDNIIEGLKLTFKEDRDAVLFKLTWM